MAHRELGKALEEALQQIGVEHLGAHGVAQLINYGVKLEGFYHQSHEYVADGCNMQQF